MRLRIGLAIGLALMVVSPVWSLPDGHGSTEIALPGKAWSVAADLRGFKITKNGLQPDGRYYLIADRDAFGFSIYLERVHGTADSSGCRDSLSGKASHAIAPLVDVRMYQSGEANLLEYTIDEFQGMKVRQKNLFACMGREDVYIDVHISKTLYQPDDEAVLQSLFQSVHFVDSSNGLQIGNSDFREGSKFYVKGDFPQAIKSYEKVLEREKAQSTLNQTTFRVLIDNLGMAYGMSGNLARAKETFEYGVSRDSTYPLFYYNLACTYGEMNDLKVTKENLVLAFKYRDNVIAGETMPEPRQDSSFQRFMSDENFRKFLDSLTK